MTLLKLIIFEYLTAFAIFCHKIEHMGSSTAALRLFFKLEVQIVDRKWTGNIVIFTLSPELYGFDPQHESGLTQIEVALEPPLPPFHSVMASVPKKIKYCIMRISSLGSKIHWRARKARVNKRVCPVISNDGFFWAL